jgi:hypothetical protein
MKKMLRIKFGLPMFAMLAALIASSFSIPFKPKSVKDPNHPTVAYGQPQPGTIEMDVNGETWLIPPNWRSISLAEITREGGNLGYAHNHCEGAPGQQICFIVGTFEANNVPAGTGTFVQLTFAATGSFY